MELPFCGGAYGGRDGPEECINFFLEARTDGKFDLVGTPGLTLRVEDLAGALRGLHRMGEFIYAVASNKVYQVNSSHIATLLGSIGTSVGPVFMEDNGTTIVLVDGSETGYTVDSALTAIADVDFEGGSDITYQDGYFIVPIPATGRFRVSDLNSATSWVDTDFATAEGAPDRINSAISDLRQIWLVGEVSTEVWDNTGDADFPFQRNPSGFIQKGTNAPQTLRRFDNSLAWLSQDERGQAMLVQANGYSTVVVSPQSINLKWSKYSTITDAFAFVFQIEGHEFYVITFPTANATWVYNATTKQWHRWSSHINSVVSRHRSSCHIFAFGRHYVGDYNSGKIYSIEPDVYTENGTAIIRDRICQTIEIDEKGSLDLFEIKCKAAVGLVTGQGSDPQIMLRTSKDDGNHYGHELTRSVGGIGNYLARATWRKLGRARRHTIWLRVSDPVEWIIHGARARSRDEPQ